MAKKILWRKEGKMDIKIRVFQKDYLGNNLGHNFYIFLFPSFKNKYLETSLHL